MKKPITFLIWKIADIKFIVFEERTCRLTELSNHLEYNCRG